MLSAFVLIPSSTFLQSVRLVEVMLYALENRFLRSLGIRLWGVLIVSRMNVPYSLMSLFYVLYYERYVSLSCIKMKLKSKSYINGF